MASDDFYVLLGVSRDASDADIKKAYRKEALKWHPDKHPDEGKAKAEDMFKAVAEAYEVLSDPNKRAIYDRGGKEALNGGGGMGGGGGGFRTGFGRGDAFNIFEQFFGGRDPFEEMDRMMAEMHGGGIGRPGAGGRRATHGGGRSPFGMGSMFDDDFFGGGFGGGGGNSFSSFSSSSGGGGGGMMTSTSTVTKIVNGKRVTVTEKTVRKPDGTVETTRSESNGDAGGAAGMIGGDPFAGFFGGGRPSRAGGNTFGSLGF
eukprot:TRINITY_DN37568_c0_g1_i1.p1 TRINITY_DN37568_c0_g1~~TRINITY_DN37568_c0_g1_i1.p1  ORF type:complete len:272 (+),score=56.16 TRINITY_DN37568_c0_g1_i1:42-818(+)